MRGYWGLAGAALMMLAGCADHGIKPILTEAGALPAPPDTTQYAASLFTAFQTAATVTVTDKSPEAYQAFVYAGFGLIDQRCRDYFSGKRNGQADANLLRGSIAPIAAVITGIIGLHSYADPANADRAINWLGLGTSTAISGLDVYTTHFLFGAENVDSVEAMVRTELATDSGIALAIKPTGLPEAAGLIGDHFKICTPAHILQSTRAAIAAGKFDGAISGEGAPADTSLLTKLGTALGMKPAIVTETQAGLLYATAMGFVHTPAELKTVRDGLAALGDANPISDTGGTLAISDNFPFAAVTKIFNEAPYTTRTALADQSKRLFPDPGTQKALGAVLPIAPRYDLPSTGGGQPRRVVVTPRS